MPAVPRYHVTSQTALPTLERYTEAVKAGVVNWTPGCVALTQDNWGNGITIKATIREINNNTTPGQ